MLHRCRCTTIPTQASNPHILEPLCKTLKPAMALQADLPLHTHKARQVQRRLGDRGRLLELAVSADMRLVKSSWSKARF